MRKLKWLLLALALYLCAELYVSNNLLQTERLTVYRDDLPQAFDGFTVAALSDAHAKRFGGGNRGLLSAVREASPDIIVLTGDLVERPDELPYAQELCEGLTTIAPVYYVTGNHEWGADWSALREGEPRFTPELFALLDDCGVQRLDNQTLELRRGGDSLRLCGLRDPNGPSGGQTPRQLVAQAEGGFTILLSHRYDRLDEYAEAGAALVFAGHAHGGLIRLPFTDGLIGPSRDWFPRHTSGLYRQGATDMVVSRGLGNVGPPRVWNRPHLPVVTLKRGEGP